MTTFITGASSALGGDLIEILRARGESVIAMLHRSTSIVTTAGAILEPVALGDEGSSDISFVRGALDQAGLGLTDGDRARLKGRVTSVVHAGALSDFGRPVDDYQRANVIGTRNLLELMRSDWPAASLVHVSTAYVGGGCSGLFSASMWGERDVVANAYEASKIDAEALVRAFCDEGRQVAIVRPSIIAGRSGDGRAREFRHLYPVVRVIGTARVETIAGNLASSLNIVPIDFVVRVIDEALRRVDTTPGLEILHAVGERKLTLKALCEVLSEFPQLRIPDVLAPALFDDLERSSQERKIYQKFVEDFEPYIQRLNDFEPCNLEMESTGCPQELLRICLSYAEQEGYFVKKSLSSSVAP